MYILLFFLVPSAFIYYSAGNRFSGQPTYRLAYMSGILAGILLALGNMLLGGLIPGNSGNIILKFLDLFFTGSFIPLLLGVPLLFYVFDSDLEGKIRRLVPQLFGIYTIYLPYIIVSDYRLPDSWILVVMPSMYLSFLFCAEFSINRYLSRLRHRPSLEDFLYALIPAFCILLLIDIAKTAWYFCLPFNVYRLIAFAVITGSILLRLRKYR